MNALEAVIRDQIAHQGPLSVAAFMELALQHPDHGYYRRHDPLGREGDFVTAPEISQMFGEMAGLWCADAWAQMGKPEHFVLLELGPGRGTLMQDALRATARIAGFHDAMDLCLLESNATLRQQQGEKLSAHAPRHLHALAELPHLPVLAVANEFFDALPIRQFEKTLQGWGEKRVSLHDEGLTFELAASDDVLPFIPAELREAKAGTVFEVSPSSLHVMRDLSQHIVRYGGAALVIDYGYADPSGLATFQAVMKHAYAPVLENVGEADLTAHVDFGALRHVAVKQGAKVVGPVGQGAFLRNMGIELRAGQLKQRATERQAEDIQQALHRLTDDAQMGILFKAMAVAAPQLSTLAGF